MKHKIMLLAGILILTFILTACSSGDRSGTSSDRTKTAAFKDSDVVILRADISDTATFIPVTVDGMNMEVVAVKAPDGTIRTAFNTCQVCYDSGRGYYAQEGDVLVCQNCGNRFEMNQVAVEKGGCNPVGITEDMRTETDAEITIPLDLLKQAEPLFGNWKKS